MSINTIIIVALTVMAFVGFAVCIYVYLRDRNLEDIRADVYQLFLQAEHTYLETGSGKQKMKYVIQQARGMLPAWLQFFITDELLYMVVQNWFDGVKDLLDDGRLNRSTKNGGKSNE